MFSSIEEGAMSGLALLRELLAIRSPSGQEMPAVRHLVAWLAAHGFSAHRDAAGNAVGVLESPTEGPAREIILLGHIDTVRGFPKITERDGRLYGRGAADDKSGVVTHAAVLRAFGGKPPVNVKLIFEGEEEADSHLDGFVLENPEPFQADMIIVGDVGNWKVGEPTLTTTLRGLAVCRVEVKTLASPVHSGMFGGPAPDALLVLINLLAGLHDDQGDPCVKGLPMGKWDGFSYQEDVFRETAGVLDGVPLVGTGSVSDRLWASPSVTVIGLDAPAVEGAPNALIPEARAQVSMRVPPGFDAEKARALLAGHLRASAPWGVEVNVTEGQEGPAFKAKTDGPGYTAVLKAMREAYGKDAVMMGQGGSIPLISNLATIAPRAEIVLWGAEDGAAAIHSANESVDLAELERCILSEALLLEYLSKK